MPKIQAIVAFDSKMGIGISSKKELPWGRLPDDMKHFVDITKGTPDSPTLLVMGRKTWENCPDLTRANRSPAIITRQSSIPFRKGESAFSSRDDLLKYAENNGHDRIVVIGGSEIYDLFRDLIDEVFVTRITGNFGCDRFFRLDLGLFESASDPIQYENRGIKFTIQKMIRGK